MAASDTARIPQITLHHDEYGFWLGGTSEALRTLAAAIATATTIHVSAVADEAEASLTVERTDGPLLMTHDGSHAVLTGSQVGVDDFAHTVGFVAEGPQIPSSVKFHAHIEYYPGHPWIEETSDAVIIQLDE